MKFPNIMDCQKCNGVSFPFFFLFFFNFSRSIPWRWAPRGPTGLCQKVEHACPWWLSCLWGWSAGLSLSCLTQESEKSCRRLLSPGKFPALMGITVALKFPVIHMRWQRNLERAMQDVLQSHPQCWTQEAFLLGWQSGAQDWTAVGLRAVWGFSGWGEAEPHWRGRRVIASSLLGMVCVPSLSYLGALS